MENGGRKIGCCGTLLLMLLFGAVAIMALAAYGYEKGYNPQGELTLSWEEIDKLENETDDPVDREELQGVDIDLSEEPAPLIDNPEHIVNILLIGQDRREGEGRGRSDTMILCTVDTKEKTMMLTSFLRDLYVDIPQWQGKSYKDNRLNACYVFGGMDLLDAALTHNFGVQVDHNIEVDFSGFEKIIEIFGGVSMELTAAEAKYLGGGLTEGVNHLTPAQALSYARIRKLDSDFGRTDRQRKLLVALVKSMENMSLKQFSKLVTNVHPVVTTDLTDGEMMRLVKEMMPILPQLKISTQTIPAAGSYQNCSVRGMAVLLPDLEVNRAILRDTLQ